MASSLEQGRAIACVVRVARRREDAAVVTVGHAGYLAGGFRGIGVFVDGGEVGFEERFVAVRGITAGAGAVLGWILVLYQRWHDGNGYDINVGVTMR